MQGYVLLRRPRSGRFCAFCDPFFPHFPQFRGPYSSAVSTRASLAHPEQLETPLIAFA